MGETVQLQIYTAYFARVRSEDGAEGFIERRHLSQSAGAAPALAAVGMIAFAIASLIAFLGSLFPWLTQYGRSSSEIGWDVGAGKLTLLLALAGGGILAARFRYPGLPEIRFLWGMTGIGALITLLTLIEAASHGNASTEYGLYLTMVAGIGMALAPWLDRWRSLQTLVNPP